MELNETILCIIRKGIPKEKVEELNDYHMKASGGPAMTWRLPGDAVMIDSSERNV